MRSPYENRWYAVGDGCMAVYERAASVVSRLRRRRVKAVTR